MILKHLLSRLPGVQTCASAEFLLFLLVGVLIGRITLSKKMEVEQLSSSIGKFSAEFLKAVDAEGSAVSSPLSAELVLALLALGSTGKSHDEILHSLHLPDDDFVRKGFAAIASKLTSVKGITFNVANKVYLKEGPYELKTKFKEDAVNVFGADVQKLNFDNGAAAASTINEWVEGKTNKRIKDLVKPDSISSDTHIVLVNALYFKGSWLNKFDATLTADAPFHVSSSKTIDVPFMAMERKFRYGESQELDSKLLELPYEGGESSLLVVLPNKVDGLNQLLETLAAGADLDVDLFETKVMVRLPKFKIETTIDLKTLLPKMGIKTIFDPNNVDLTGLLDNSQHLFVSEAVQKAFIEVNEEGAEAAAATVMGVMMMSAMVEFDPPTFVADRPFLVIVKVGDARVFWATVRDSFSL